MYADEGHNSWLWNLTLVYGGPLEGSDDEGGVNGGDSGEFNLCVFARIALGPLQVVNVELTYCIVPLLGFLQNSVAGTSMFKTAFF